MTKRTDSEQEKLVTYKYYDDMEENETLSGELAGELWRDSVVGAFLDEADEDAECQQCDALIDDCECEDGPHYWSDAFFDYDMAEFTAEKMLKAWEYSRGLDFSEINYTMSRSDDVWHAITILMKDEDNYPSEWHNDLVLVQKYINDWADKDEEALASE